jgi:TolB-like protein
MAVPCPAAEPAAPSGAKPAAPVAVKPAAPPATQPATTQPAKADPKTLTIAVLDFDAKNAGSPELGGQISEAIVAMLSGEPGIALVDRSSLARTLQEHELNLSGAVSTEQAVQVGKLVGARILVTGKAFLLGKQTFITAKMIGTETSLVEGLLVKGADNADIGELAVELAGKLADRLREVGSKLVADDDAAKDPLPALQAKLKGRKLPKVAVIITEEHHAQRVARPTVDPAVETEVKLLLRKCGFDVRDVEQNDLADWAKLMSKNDVNAWPRGLRDVDVVITGEAFSEFAARIGNLVSCLARAEVNVISRSDGKIVIADRQTTRAVDLAENIAGKKALEKAGRALGIRILEHYAKEPPKP